MNSSQSLDFTRTIPLRGEWDVVVAGGGPAGIAAALAAARQGGRVLLVEGQNCLGGMGTAGLVPWFCGNTDGVRTLAEGVWREVRTRMFDAGGFGPPARREDDHSWLTIQPEALKRVYDDLVTEAGVEVLLQTHLADVQRDGRRVSHAICQAKSGLFAVAAKVFVDATGDGDLCARAEAAFEKGDADGTMMPGTLCSLWTDIDWEAVHRNSPQDDPLGRAIRDGVFTIPDRHLPGIAITGAHTGGANIGHTFEVDGTDERSLTKALMWGRKLLVEYRRFYRDYMPGYAHAEPVATGGLLGIRESRRITGEYVMVIDDYLRRAVFEDEIGRCAYWIDQHAGKAGDGHFQQFESTAKKYTLEKGESYGIPLRALVVRDLDNVLVAGRCLSADRLIQSSIRVMPICFITGQAAGAAAALAATRAGAVRAVEAKALQRVLLTLGAYLPNAKG